MEWASKSDGEGLRKWTLETRHLLQGVWLEGSVGSRDWEGVHFTWEDNVLVCLWEEARAAGHRGDLLRMHRARRWHLQAQGGISGRPWGYPGAEVGRGRVC